MFRLSVNFHEGQELMDENNAISSRLRKHSDNDNKEAQRIPRGGRE